MSRKVRNSVGFACSLLAIVLAGSHATGDDQVPPTTTGTIKGHLTIDGKTEHHKFAIDESVVNLKGAELAKLTKIPTEPAVLDQNGIAYIPTILPVVAGTTIEFRNSDPTVHNVHCTCRLNNPANIGMKEGEKQTLVFKNPEVVEVTCNIHANMKAFIVVLENGFFSKVNKEGEFKIENVPPGEYEVRGWHDGTTPAVQKVTVKAGAEAVVDINLTTKKRGR